MPDVVSPEVRSRMMSGIRGKDTKPEMLVRDAAGNEKKITVQSAPSHNYILGVDFQGDDLWVATAHGLSHGVRQKSSEPVAKVLGSGEK